MGNSGSSQSEPHKSSLLKVLTDFLTSVQGLLTALAGVVAAAIALFALFLKPGEGPKPPAAGPIVAITTPSSRMDAPTSQYPQTLDINASASAGDYQFQILGAKLEEYGVDPDTKIKTLLLRLKIREAFIAKYGTGYFMNDGFRLVVGETISPPKESPIQNIAHGTTQDGEVTFLVPESAKEATLRVGYYDGQKSDISLKLTR